MNDVLRKVYYSFTKPGRVAVLDYAVAPKPLYTPETKPHARLNEVISKNDHAYEDLIEGSLQHKDKFATFPLQPDDSLTPAWENSFFPAFDTTVSYTILEKFKPSQYVEIGSGNSTKLAHFCRKEEGLSFTITSFDPNPRRENQSHCRQLAQS